MSMHKVFVLSLAFLFVATIFTFVLMLVQETVGSTFLDEFADQGKEIMSGNTAVQNNITALRNDYDDAKFDYNILFFIMWMVMELSIIALALKMPKLPQWSFLTLLFFGIIFMNFAYSFVMDITSWFFNEYILKTFPADVTYMPFYEFFNDWQLLIFVVNIAGALLINNLWGKGAGTIPENPFIGGG